MFFAALLFAAVPADTAHCLEAVHCPSVREIEAAIRQNDIEQADLLNAAANPPSSDTYYVIKAQAIRRITGIFCGGYDEATGTVTCQAWVQYRAGRKLVMLRFHRDDSGWKAEESLEIYHPRGRI